MTPLALVGTVAAALAAAAALGFSAYWLGQHAATTAARSRREPSPEGEPGAASAGPAALSSTPAPTAPETSRKWTAPGPRTVPGTAAARARVIPPEAQRVVDAGTSPAGPGDPPGLGPAFELGGRWFRVIRRSTIAQDVALMRYIRAAGLDAPTVREHELPEDFARRLLFDLVEGIDVRDLIGCLVVPDGLTPEQWTPAVGRDVAAHVGQISDEVSKAAIRGLLSSFLLDFFGNGQVSLWRSAPPSPEPGGEAPGQGPARPTATTTVTGMPSSEESPAPTTTSLGG